MTLAEFIAENGLDHDASMDKLQECGIISSECVMAEDVAPADYEAAITFLGL